MLHKDIYKYYHSYYLSLRIGINLMAHETLFGTPPEELPLLAIEKLQKPKSTTQLQNTKIITPFTESMV